MSEETIALLTKRWMRELCGVMAFTNIPPEVIESHGWKLVNPHSILNDFDAWL